MIAPLFILSFRHRDELTRLAEGAGWQPIAARRAENAEARFVSSGAAVAVVDARGALNEGEEAVRSIADAAEANAAALLVLLSRKDAAALDRFHLFGATHFLVSPFTEPQLLHALQFALRHAERVGGGGSRRAGDARGEGESWRWQPGSRTVELSPALARKAGLGENEGRRISLIDLFRKLDPEGRRAARGAIVRVMATGEATAFAHADFDDEGARIAHHVRVQAEGGIVGRAEAINAVEARAGASRDPLTGLGDGRAARAWLAERLGSENAGPIVMLLLSVSRYDAINAAFGRSVGDAVLQAAARRIERHADPDGRRILVARMAGAECAVMLAPPVPLGDGRLLRGELVEAIGRPSCPAIMSSRSAVAPASPSRRHRDDAPALLRRTASRRRG